MDQKSLNKFKRTLTYFFWRKEEGNELYELD